MSFFDLNAAEIASSGGADGSPIPDNTVVRAIMSIRPGGAGNGGAYAITSGGTLYIDAEFAVTEGPFAMRRFWVKFWMTEKGAPITMRQLRSIVESHFGIRPDDTSDAAQAKRRVTMDQLNGLEACFLLGIDDDGVHKARNEIKAIIMPGDRRYLAHGQAAPAPAASNVAAFQAPAAPAFAPAPAPSAPAANKPAWAV